jgi:PAS domain S-box-containing protein
MKTAGLLTLPLFILLIAVFILLNIKTDFEPPLVLPVMNTLFLGIIPVFIASVAYRTYRINGSASVLLLGSGMLVFGLGSIAAGWLIGFPDGSNIAITIYNTSAFIGSAFSLAAVLLVLTGAIPVTRKTEPSVPFLAYGGAIAFIALFSYAAVEGVIPPFFIPVSGPTVLRQVVLSYAGVMYTLTSVLFFVLYQRKRDDFFFWFSLALGLIATGLFAVLFLSAMGSLTVWTGRIAEYVGACFALVAILTARETATRSGISLPAQFGTFFGREAATNAILAAAQESIWLFGTDDTIRMANPTALERLGGRSAGEVIGHRYQEFMSKELAQSRRARLEEVMRKKEPVRFEDERNGILFDHSFYPVFDDDGTVTGIAAFSRDITAVRNAEDALFGINEELTATNEELTAMQEDLQQNLDQLRRSEQKLRESEERYRTVADFTMDWEFWFGPDGKFIYISPSAEQILGRPVSNYTSVEPFLREVVHPEDLSLRLAHLKDELSGKGPSELEFRIVRPDGEVRWIHHICRPIRDPSERFLGTRGSNRDITERRQAEDAIRKSEKKYRNLFTKMGEGFALHEIVCNTAGDPTDYRFLEINPAFEHLTGLKRENVVGKLVSEILPGTEEIWIQRYGAVALTGKPDQFENYSAILNRYYTVVAFSPAPRQFAVLFSDVTEQRKAAEALKESEERFRVIAETSPVLLSVSSLADGTVLFTNPAYESAFGFSRMEPVGWKAENLFFNSSERDEIIATLKNEGVIRNREVMVKRKDGTPFWISVSMALVHFGGAEAIMGASVNITDRRQAEAALRESEDRMRFALETSHTGAWDLDLTDHTARRSLEHDRVFGYTTLLPAWTYEMFLDHVLLEDRASVDAKFRHAMETGGDWNFECRIRRTDGEIRWIWAAGRHRTDRPGSRVRMAGIVQDITDRKQAEDALKKARDELEMRVEERTAELQGAITALSAERHRLYDVLEGLPAYVCLLDADYRMPFANKTFRETFAEPGGRRCYEFLFDRTEPCEICESYTVMKTRAPHHWYWTGPNGRDYDIYDFPFTDTDGSYMILEMGIDITERKKAEKAVRKANAYNRSLIEASLDPLVTISPEGTISDVNEATIRVTGFSREELVGTDFSDYFTEPEKAKAGYEMVFRDGSVTDYALEIRHKNGQVTPVLYNAAVYRDDAGNVTGVFAAARDITGRKKAEEELRKAHDLLEVRVEERTAELAEANTTLQNEIEIRRDAEEALRETSQYLEKLITHANAPIIVWDRDFRITRFNHAAEILTGKKAEDMIGERIEVIFPEKYVPEVMDLIRLTMTGEQLHVMELPVLHRSGSVRVVLWNSASLYGPDGKTIESTIAQGQDITVRKRAEAELQRKNKELQILNEEITATQEELQQNVDELYRSEDALRKNEADLREALSEKEVLLAEIHHRVKNNLTAFISLLSLEGSYEESPAGLALKKDLQNRARSMALIHETLYRTGKYSSVEMGMYLSTLVGQIASSFDPEQAVRIVVSCEGVSIDLARATPCGLIVNELVTNSFKYAFPASFDCPKIRGEPCTITISIAEEGDAYVMTVRDNGIGLPAGFDARQARSLGLKLVNFLARHQLRTNVDILSGDGTAFEFRFPVNQQHRKGS